MKENYQVILLVVAFVPIFIAFGALVWGMSMLTDSYERRWAAQDELRAWEAREPIRNALFDGAAKAGFTNSDLIFNRTTLCWYKYETDTLYGECDGERERIDQIKLESKKYENITWSYPVVQTTEWQSISNGSES